MPDQTNVPEIHPAQPETWSPPQAWSPPVEWLPPQIEQRHAFTTTEKVRIVGGLALAAAGQALVSSMNEVSDKAIIDAVAIPVVLGIVLSIPEMRHRMSHPIAGVRAIRDRIAQR
jgi:hypothetical protein